MDRGSGGIRSRLDRRGDDDVLRMIWIALALWPLPGALLICVRAWALRRNNRAGGGPNAPRGGTRSTGVPPFGGDGCTIDNRPIYLDERVQEVMRCLQ